MRNFYAGAVRICSFNGTFFPHRGEEGSATVRSSCSLGRVRCSSDVSGKAALSITRRPGASDRRAGWGAESCYSLERLS